VNKRHLLQTIPLFFLVLQSCEKGKSETDSYTKNAEDLVAHITKNENLICDCIVQLNSLSLFEETILLMPDKEVQFKNKVKEILGVENEADFENIVSIGKDFRFTPAMFNGKLKIINREEIPNQFESLTTEKSKKFLEKCPKFSCWISKPIFNKSFTKAIITNEYGASCFYTSPSVYFKFRGTWEVSSESNFKF